MGFLYRSDESLSAEEGEALVQVRASKCLSSTVSQLERRPCCRGRHVRQYTLVIPWLHDSLDVAVGVAAQARGRHDTVGATFQVK